METTLDKATQKFMSGYNCAQSVLWAFAPELDVDPGTALKVATGFGAGMGRRQETCGAVTGGIMALGLKYGRGEGQDRAATEDTYGRTLDLVRRFEAKHGTTSCRQLLGGCDLATDEGRKALRERLHGTVCKSCVQTVVEILEDMFSGPRGSAKGEK